MDFQRILIPVVALVVAGVTAFVANSFIEAKPEPVQAIAAPPPEIQYKEVLVAAGPVNPGSFLSKASFRWQKWPDVDVPSTYLVRGSSDPAELEGAVARQSILSGDPILQGSLVRPGDRGFLAAVLEPGMRAVSVPVDEASSNAGLIQPGDRVDVIVTQTLVSEANFAASRHVSETVLQDVRVIAMGRSLEGAGNNLDPDQQRQARTATLEVSPRGAEKVALVTELGKLSLSLRSLASNRDEMSLVDAGETAGSTWDSDVSSVRRPTKGSGVTVIRGASQETLNLDVGGIQ